MKYLLPNFNGLTTLVDIFNRLASILMQIEVRLNNLEAAKYPAPNPVLTPNPALPIQQMTLAANASTGAINCVLEVNCTSASTLTITPAYPGSWLTIINTGSATITLSDGTHTIGTIAAGATSGTNGTSAGYSSLDRTTVVPM